MVTEYYGLIMKLSRNLAMTSAQYPTFYIGFIVRLHNYVKACTRQPCYQITMSQGTCIPISNFIHIKHVHPPKKAVPDNL